MYALGLHVDQTRDGESVALGPRAKLPIFRENLVQPLWLPPARIVFGLRGHVGSASPYPCT